MMWTLKPYYKYFSDEIIEINNHESQLSYTTLIRYLMQGYGDSNDPLYESAHMIQCILRQQMNSLLSQLTDSAKMQANNKITYKEIMYLFRNNKDKLRDLLKFIMLNDPIDELNKGKYKKDTQESDVNKFDYGPLRKKQKTSKLNKNNSFRSAIEKKVEMQSRAELCEAFLRFIDGTRQIYRVVNEARQEIIEERKNPKRTEINVPLSTRNTTFFIYQDARQAFFIVDNFKEQEFKTWLYEEPNNFYNLDDFAFEIVGFLAQQTVATIVQCSLLTRRDKKSNLIEKLELPKACNTDYVSYRLLSDYFFKRYGGQTIDYYQCCIKHFCSLFFKPESELRGRNGNAITPDDIMEVLFRFYQRKGPFDCRSCDELKKLLFCC